MEIAMDRAKRSQFGARIRLALREKLEAAAQENGRSVSEEAEARLEASFILEGALMGPDPLRMAAVFVIAGQRAAEYENHPEWIATGEWRADPACYETAIFAVTKMLWQQHPNRSKVEQWSWREWCGRLTSYLGGFSGATRENIERVPVSNGDRDAGRHDREELARRRES
jgi:hypothetical protein